MVISKYNKNDFKNITKQIIPDVIRFKDCADFSIFEYAGYTNIIYDYIADNIVFMCFLNEDNELGAMYVNFVKLNALPMGINYDGVVHFITEILNNKFLGFNVKKDFIEFKNIPKWLYSPCFPYDNNCFFIDDIINISSMPKARATSLNFTIFDSPRPLDMETYLKIYPQYKPFFSNFIKTYKISNILKLKTYKPTLKNLLKDNSCCTEGRFLCKYFFAEDINLTLDKVNHSLVFDIEDIHYNCEKAFYVKNNTLFYIFYLHNIIIDFYSVKYNLALELQDKNMFTNYYVKDLKTTTAVDKFINSQIFLDKLGI